MRKIIFLIVLLCFITISSSFIKYENFTTIFKLKFKSSDNYKMENKFPKQDFKLDNYGRLCIQVLNDTTGSGDDTTGSGDDNTIIVWLDDLPFCDKWIQEDSEGEFLLPPESITRGVKENNGKYEKNCGFYTGNESTDGNNWEDYISKMEARYITDTDKDKIPRFMIINSDGSVYWDSKKRKNYDGITKPNIIKRYFKLKPLQVLRVVPPHKIQNKFNFETKTGVNMGYVPYMCMLQYTDTDIHAGDRGVSFGEYDTTASVMKGEFGAYKNCGGAGIYITDNLDISKSGENITTQSVSRVEYNINNGEIYFNFSAVDGSNINYEAKYDLSEGDNGTVTVSSNDLDKFCKRTDINCDTIKIDEIATKLSGDNVYSKLDEYLFYTNRNPYIKSIPSIKAFANKCGNLYYKQVSIGNGCATDGSGPLEPDSDSDYKCISPIQFSDTIKGDGNTYSNEWTYWEKAIFNMKIYKKDLKEDTTDIYLFDGSNINSYTSANQLGNGAKPTIQECIKNLKFNLTQPPDTGLSKDSDRPLEYPQTYINDKNCADAPYGYGPNKAICHIWWGLSTNKCAKDYTDLIRNVQPDGSMGCTQYTWAYGEMGYDLANNQLQNILDRTGIENKKLYFSNDGNPQKYSYCDPNSTTRCNSAPSVNENIEECKRNCEGKKKNDIPKENNLESANKPLLNCQIPNKALDKYKDLKKYPVNINISIKYIQTGKVTLKDEDKARCTAGDRDGNDCTKATQKQPNGTVLDMNCLVTVPDNGKYEPVCASDEKNNCLKALFDPKPNNKIWCGDI